MPAANQLEVELPTGAPFTVLTEEEADYIENLIARYQSEFEFTNISDLAELDRLVGMELRAHRYDIWLGTERDYEQEPIGRSGLLQRAKEQSLEIRQVKKLLGIDKTTRDRARGAGSLAEYLRHLRERAMALGIHRVAQLNRMLELGNQLVGMVTAAKNFNDAERRRFGLTDAEIVQWIRDVFWPEYNEIDQHFREHTQSFWTRS